MTPTGTSSELVEVTHQGPWVKVLTMNRGPKRNALSVALIDKLLQEVEAAGQDANARVLVLRGAGPVFCAGLDLHEVAIAGGMERSAKALASLYKTICHCPLITIAAAQGTAIGGGAGLVCACDMAVATDDLRIIFPEVHRGLVAALVTCLLRRQVSDHILRELVLMGQPVVATEALRIGLLNHVAGAAKFDAMIAELALTAARGSPTAVRRSKQELVGMCQRPIDVDLDLALEYHLSAGHTPEAAEGIAAFMGNRPAKWARSPVEKPER